VNAIVRDGICRDQKEAADDRLKKWSSGQAD
jgi:hypothetical protein